jgi:pimeloyl-ACP methyl ester carboxylesterase
VVGSTEPVTRTPPCAAPPPPLPPVDRPSIARRARAVALGLVATTAIAACGAADASDTSADTTARPSTSTTSAPTTTSSTAPAPTTTVPTLADAVDLTGTLDDGATWHLEAPADWNGTLLVYSHGLVPPGEENPATDAPDPVTAAALLDRGYALAGTSYATTGYAVAEAIVEQSEIVDVFAAEVGEPTTTIAWGSSLGGMVTAALLEQQPDRFDGGLAMCGVLAGTLPVWDSYLDTLFALKTLLAPDAAIELTGASDPFASIDVLREAVIAAQGTPEGRARIALAASIGGIPGWAGAGNARPDATDIAGRQEGQLGNLETVALFGLALRADLEARVGGNPSTNVGVDYAELLALSDERDAVEALYAAAGLDLAADLGTLADAPRIEADPAARTTAAAAVTFDGRIADPLLTLHDEGDALAPAQHERAYADLVDRAGTQDLLRQVFTERAGHCVFSPGETVAALEALVERVQTGEWPATDAAAMNARAEGLGPDLNVHFEDGSDVAVPTPSAFTAYEPGPFPRA